MKFSTCRILNHFTGGMNNVVADLLWLRCIQYIGKENKGERNFIWLNQLLDTVVQLDPYFGDAYRYGGTGDIRRHGPVAA